MDTFGYTTAGISTWNGGDNVLRAGVELFSGGASTLNSISVYSSGIGNIYLGIYNSSGNLLSQSGAVAVSDANWYTANLTGNLSDGTYRLAWFGDALGVKLHYNSVPGASWSYKTGEVESFSNPITWSGTFTDERVSIYATYTPSGGASPVYAYGQGYLQYG